MVDLDRSPASGTWANLVVVCCHAVYTSDGVDTGEEHWALKPFQRSRSDPPRPSEHHTMIAHIVAGAAAVEADPHALLIFSGGRTADHPTSEAAGYESIFLHMDNFHGARRRYTLEERSTDSYQNLLFSILRFRRCTGRYPRRITVVTYAFKARRFFDLHAPAVAWPRSRIRVHGIDPPFTLDELEDTQAAERARGYEPFRRDPYGVGAELAAKRRARNWDDALLDELCDDADPNVHALLRWDGGTDGSEPFPGHLPWRTI